MLSDFAEKYYDAKLFSNQYLLVYIINPLTASVAYIRVFICY